MAAEITACVTCLVYIQVVHCKNDPLRPLVQYNNCAWPISYIKTDVRNAVRASCGGKSCLHDMLHDYSTIQKHSEVTHQSLCIWTV